MVDYRFLGCMVWALIPLCWYDIHALWHSNTCRESMVNDWFLGWVVRTLVPLCWYDMLWHSYTVTQWHIERIDGRWLIPRVSGASIGSALLVWHAMTLIHCDTVTHRKNRWSMIGYSGERCEPWFRSAGMTPMYCVQQIENPWSIINSSGKCCEPWFRSAGMTPMHCDRNT